MASKIQHLLCEALRFSIEKHQKDETLLPKVMTVVQNDFVDYFKLRESVGNNEVDILEEMFNDISIGTLTPDICRKWMNGR